MGYTSANVRSLIVCKWGSRDTSMKRCVQTPRTGPRIRTPRKSTAQQTGARDGQTGCRPCGPVALSPWADEWALVSGPLQSETTLSCTGGLFTDLCDTCACGGECLALSSPVLLTNSLGRVRAATCLLKNSHFPKSPRVPVSSSVRTVFTMPVQTCHCDDPLNVSKMMQCCSK